MPIGRRNLHLIKQPVAGDKEVRKFGLLFAALGVLVGAYMAWKGIRSLWIPFGLAGIFLLTGLAIPRMLRPFYVAWMRFASILAWINTRVLLSAFFFLVLTPIGLVMRLMGKDLLDKKIDRSAKSYWVKQAPGLKGNQSYEHLF
jgi:Saxitoxin biosynthesis operon protein SxtJ